MPAGDEKNNEFRLIFLFYLVAGFWGSSILYSPYYDHLKEIFAVPSGFISQYFGWRGTNPFIISDMLPKSHVQ